MRTFAVLSVFVELEAGRAATDAMLAVIDAQMRAAAIVVVTRIRACAHDRIFVVSVTAVILAVAKLLEDHAHVVTAVKLRFRVTRE